MFHIYQSLGEKEFNMESQGLPELFDRITDSTKQATKAVAFSATNHGEPPGYYFLQQPGAAALLALSKAKWHGERIASPAELVKFIIERRADMKKPALYYNETGIVLIYDQDDRRDRAFCPLQFSEQYHWLFNEECESMTQYDFVRSLRVKMQGCVDQSNLLSMARKVSWQTGTDATGTVLSNSLGKSINSRVTGQEGFPEDISFTIPIFNNHPKRLQILCDLELNPQGQTFTVTPFPQVLRNAVEAALDDILFTLSGDKDNIMPPAFRGNVDG